MTNKNGKLLNTSAEISNVLSDFFWGLHKSGNLGAGDRMYIFLKKQKANKLSGKQTYYLL